MHRRYLELIIAAALCAGCQTQAQRTNTELKDRFTVVKQNTQQCVDTLSANPVAKKVGSEILFAKPDDPNRFELATIKSKLTPEQKSTLKEYISIGLNCRNIVIDGYRGLPVQQPYMDYYAKMDQIYVGLLSGELSIGDANRLKMTAINSLQSESRAAGEKIDQSLANAHNAELAQRQKAWRNNP